MILQYSLGENTPDTILKSLSTRICKTIWKECGDVCEWTDELARNGLVLLNTYDSRRHSWDEWEMYGEFDSGDFVVRVKQVDGTENLKLRVSDTVSFLAYVRQAAVQIKDWLLDIGAIKAVD